MNCLAKNSVICQEFYLELSLFNAKMITKTRNCYCQEL
uniref:Uncharacterized protein n=1 Tax=Arundo donax TaxID=35708 RepID=A0A0A8YPI6_ARUDO